MSKYDFNVTPKEAVQLQLQLRDRVKLVPLKKPPTLIGGCDVSMNRFAKEGFGGFVTLSYPQLELIDHAVVKSTIPFPYVPGLLSFREIPMLLKAWETLKTKPQVIIVDGLGIAHPRRIGLASHLGLVLKVPTIGCAKSLYLGEYLEPANTAGAFSYIHDPKTEGEIIGAAVRTKVNCKPIYISPGHRITLEESISIVLASIKKHRLPEETRLAHTVVNRYRKGAAT